MEITTTTINKATALQSRKPNTDRTTVCKTVSDFKRKLEKVAYMATQRRNSKHD